jgi:hypothetical protein
LKVLAVTVEKPRFLVFLHRNLLISLTLNLRKTAKLDFFDTYEKAIVKLEGSFNCPTGARNSKYLAQGGQKGA